jgi:hippurate hydrolase
VHLRDDANAMLDDLVRLRRELHQVPEVGLDIPRTQERVLTALQGLPLEISTGKGTSSITGVLRGAAPGPTVLLRGDMDALPVAEKLPLDYASTNGNMHACGHDLHTSMLVGAARLLSQHRDHLAGDVLFMFQPGEEGYDGAGVMLAEGLLDATGTMPSAAYALHVGASLLPPGFFASKPGPLMAAVDTLTVVVRGRGGHGSAPHMALDPNPATCEMVLALQSFVTRSFDVFDPVVLTVGTIQAGTAVNVIPDEARFEASIRSCSPAAREKVLEQCGRVVRGIAAAHGCEIDVDVQRQFPVTVNDATKLGFVADRVRELHGEERYFEMPHPTMGSEDFSKVLELVPGAMVILGAAPAGVDPATAAYNHSPLAEFNDSVLADGAALYADLALAELAGT